MPQVKGDPRAENAIKEALVEATGNPASDKLNFSAEIVRGPLSATSKLGRYAMGQSRPDELMPARAPDQRLTEAVRTNRPLVELHVDVNNASGGPGDPTALNNFIRTLPPNISDGVLYSRNVTPAAATPLDRGMTVVMTVEAYDAFIQRMEALRSARLGVAAQVAQNAQPAAPARIPEVTGPQANTGPQWISADGTKKNFNVEMAVMDVVLNADGSVKSARVVADEGKVADSKPGERHVPQRWWFEKGKHDLSPGKEYKVADRAGVGRIMNDGGVPYRLQPGTEPERNATPPGAAAPAAVAPVVAAPAPAPQAEFKLPTTPTNATSLEQLAAIDLRGKLGGADQTHEPAAAYETAHRQFYEAMNETIYSKTRDYFNSAPGSSERATAEREIIQSVNAMPDSYKALAVGYVKEALHAKAPIVPDDYKSMGTSLFLGDKNRNDVLAQLKQKDEAMAPAAPAAAATQEPLQGFPAAVAARAAQLEADNARHAAEVAAPQVETPAGEVQASADIYQAPPSRHKTAPMNNEQLNAMMPPARIVTANDLVRANGSAMQLIGSMQMTYMMPGMPVNGAMSKPQIEEVINAHVKAKSPFADDLQKAYGRLNGGENSTTVGRDAMKAINEEFNKLNIEMRSRPQAELMQEAARGNYVAAQVPGGPLGESLTQPFERKADLELAANEKPDNSGSEHNGGSIHTNHPRGLTEDPIQAQQLAAAASAPRV